MEYVGRRVKKEVQGEGTFFGSVQAHEPETGVFKVVYDSGSSEDLDFSAVVSLLVVGDSSSPQPSGSGGRETGSSPKKRRCIDNQGKGSDNLRIESGISDNLVDRDGNSGKFDLNLNKVLDLNDDAVNALNDGDHEIKSVGVGAELRGLDLNEEVTLELGDGFGLENGAVEGKSGGKKEIIDLNLDVNEDFENSSNGGARIPFDLNLKFPEDEITNLEAREGQIGSNESVCAEASEQRVDLAEDDRKGITVNEESEMGNLVPMESEEERLVDVENKVHSPLENCVAEVGNGDVAPVISQKKKRGRKRKDVSNNNIPAVHASQELLEVSTQNEKINLQLENTKETPSMSGNDNDNDNGVLGSVMRGRRGRKRKELQENDVTLPTPETGLRRSSRRAKRAEVSEPDQVPNAEVPDVINNQLSSPAISVVSEEKILVPTHGKTGDHVMQPPKVELPPSSRDLDLNGVSVFDVVSVYSFLRSFSTLLFLSPFELGDFVVSLKSNDSTSLFDCIHLSLLKTLRKHLESLSEEGSVSASNLLRSLNWDLLDLITWPMYLVEYLLLHSPGHVPGFVGGQLKLLYDDYYQLPLSAKVDILQHLCDDVVEVEAFRLELNERGLATDRQIDLDRVKLNSLRKRKAAKDASTSCITEEARDPSDWNSDECSLCKMDGTLLCCDGCPAAFHSKCVGVFTEGLPPGNWYCPECSVNNDKLIRGAEQLGVDPYQRVYYNCCGYLLVLELCNDKYLSWAYDQNDLPTLIEALESSLCTHETLINAIRKQWDCEVRGSRNDLDARSSSIQSTSHGRRQILEMNSAPSETLNNNGAIGEKISVEKLIVAANSEPENAKFDTAMLETGDLGVKIDNHLASSEGSAEVSQTFVQIDTLKESGGKYSKRYVEISDHCRNRGMAANAADQYVAPISVNNEKGKNISSESCGYAPDTACTGGVFSEVYRAVNFVNLYEFARTASAFYEDWTSKSSDRTPEGIPRPSEETIAKQLKVVTNRFANFSWSNIRQSRTKMRKERCGWCFYCRAQVDEEKCLFVMNQSIPDIENYTSELLGIQPRENIKNHLVDVMCYILCIEDHLQGLLLGPWLNQQFSILWRESVLGVADISSLKKLLLKLESNLHHLAFSADWEKHVDTVPTVGSACHIISRLSSKHACDRKRANPSKVETSQSSSAATGLSLFWWRGGKGSRMLFNWKVLPHCLASKAARQGGCKKIQGILYPESGEYVKRTKCASWRAAVETSRSVHQLALQVRELDANIRWDDIGNSNLLLKIDTESKKPVRSFKKVIIRRKSSEGGMVKYLLDFGKRRFIPDVVVKHGSIVEDASSNRKKYWLEDSHVPLHLLKSFEEKRIARKSNTVRSGKLRDSIGLLRSSSKRKDFSYLFSRAERLENYQCGHCKKDVLIRDAVSCQHCEGFFHIRHVQKSAGSTTTACTYTCHKCQSGKNVKIDGRKRKSESTEHKKNVSKRARLLRQGKGKGKGKWRGKGKGKQLVISKNSGKTPMAIPLRRSARNAARVARRSLQSAKAKGRKRGRKPKSANITSKSPKINNWKNKRMSVNSSFWLNGLWLSRRPDDVRLSNFRNTMLLVLPGEDTYVHAKPTCNLCGELEHKSELIYVACEICGVWFHGDALNLTAGRVENIIGFKCYTCLKKNPPACPHQFPTGSGTEHTGEDADCLV